MSLIDTILILLIILLIIALIFSRKSNIAKKSASVKKAEIIEAYKNDMQRLIREYSNNQNELKTRKIEFIKTVNIELSKNIFFDKEDIKRIVFELSNM